MAEVVLHVVVNLHTLRIVGATSDYLVAAGWVQQVRERFGPDAAAICSDVIELDVPGAAREYEEATT